MRTHSLYRITACLSVMLLLTACSLSTPMPLPATSLPVDTDLPLPGAPEGAFIRFVNLVDGGSIAATQDDLGQNVVLVQVEVSGGVGEEVYLTEGIFGVLDVAANWELLDPFLAEVAWVPSRGGGEYTLTAHATLSDKSEIVETIQITVTGIAALPPTPPPLDEAGAQERVSELILQEFGVSIPRPAVHRFDNPYYPMISRWIGSAWYDGMRYYVDVYDDTHFAWSSSPYSDPAHIQNMDRWTYCKPVGHYKILVLYVDYANLMSDPQAAVAAVPRVADWMNDLYRDYALSQGLSEAPLSIEAEGAFAGPPPEPGEVLTASQILSLTGKVAADYDLIVEIDLDPQVSFAERYYPGVLGVGGGLALQGCDAPFFGAINIYSVVDDESTIEGALVMDFNHELSHFFGMVDNWPFSLSGTSGPSGEPVNDWIAYPILGWTDVDGDGVIEILDPTPYGTAGPQP